LNSVTQFDFVFDYQTGSAAIKHLVLSTFMSARQYCEEYLAMASPAFVTNLGSNGRRGPLPAAAARRAHLATRIRFTGFDGIR
jgi:hypothetical protein